MDDNSEHPREGAGRHGAPPERGRASLVERAAGKIVDGANRKQASPPSAESLEPLLPQPPLAEAWAEPLPQASEPVPPLAGDAPEAFAPRAEPDAVPAGTPPAQPAAKPRKQRSVKIDLAALASRNIITPLTKRNRTVEEFRLIKRMVLSRRWDGGDGPGNTILVTSALPSEGKTTTAINLAMSIAAEEDLRVVLVDADFIKPDALRQLGVSASKGLIDVLQDPRMDIGDVLLKTDIDKLSLIPAGPLHDRCTELLASARMDEVISELASRYEDRILIFDSPPLLATTEAVALASHMGQVVYVVQAGRTKRESVSRALELLGDRRHLGLILNRTSTRFGKSEFGAYYGTYYYGYGHALDEKKPEAQ